MTDNEPEPRPKKKKTWLIVLLAVGIPVLCGIVCCGGLGIWGFNMGKDLLVAVEAAQNFLNDLSGKRINEAYQSTAASYKANTSPEQFRTFLAKYPGLTAGGGVQISGMRVVQQAGPKRSAVNAVVGPANSSVSCTITLVNEDNAWRVEALTVP